MPPRQKLVGSEARYDMLGRVESTVHHRYNHEHRSRSLNRQSTAPQCNLKGTINVSAVETRLKLEAYSQAGNKPESVWDSQATDQS